MLNLKYKKCVRRHVIDIIPYNIPHFDHVTPENNYVSIDECVHKDVEVDIVVANIEVVNNNNKKSHEIVTRKNAQLVVQGYAEGGCEKCLPQ